MTREEIYNQCIQRIDNTNTLLLELSTGVGKTKISIDLANHIITNTGHNKIINVLILVAKRVHKHTWQEEIEKWGGINHPTSSINICMECYESLKKHSKEHWDIIIADEIHHIGSELRLNFLSTMTFGKLIGLSATIPKKLKQLLVYKYRAQIVSCDIVEAIEDDILPEPQILLFPLVLDNRQYTETWEINSKVKGPIYTGTISELWKYKRQKAHAILSCTQKQKLMEFDKLIEWEKSKFMSTNSIALKQSWLFHAGKRLEYLADIKLPIIKDILKYLQNDRTITFCKSIAQAEIVCKNCIHSKNADSDAIYNKFNQKKIKHISAVNILNENANLVDCKYAVFCNFSSSDVVGVQRMGRSLRHKSPVIIFPYYVGTREEEIVKNYIEGFNKECIKTIYSIFEI